MLARLIDLVGSRHPCGLLILEGKVAPPSWNEIWQILEHQAGVTRGEIDRSIKPPKNTGGYQAHLVEEMEPYEKTLESVGGWKRIQKAVHAFRLEYGVMWKAYCMYVSRVERAGWVPRSGRSSPLVSIATILEIDRKTVTRYREKAPHVIADLVALPDDVLECLLQ